MPSATPDVTGDGTTIYDLIPSLKRRHSTRLAAASQPSQDGANNAQDEQDVNASQSSSHLSSPPTEATEPATESKETEVDITPSKRFSFADADVLLRSNDGHEFSVHRCILIAASENFETILRNPPTSSKRRKIGNNTTSLPVISTDETGEELDILLTYIYPRSRPNNVRFRHLSFDILLLDRWNILTIRDDLGRQLCSDVFIQENPVAVYNLAKKMGFVDAQHAALKHLYGISFEGNRQYFLDDGIELTAKDLQQIMMWKKEYLRSVMAVVDGYIVPPINHRNSCTKCVSAKQWCWWNTFKKKLHNWNIFNRDTIDKVVFLSLAATECQAPYGDTYKAIKLLHDSLEKEIDKLPVSFE
ncbi:hypothetical protein SISNIDRAFT_496915 [Sistotremastrum niveocremeum HHB9708]|uniref:BTB domain-containing protein n=1 Tax=Sistotremastrum niveocremeum HHB9708 TaxID=1314777 RepID=A0A164RJW0_9AGAM|nr:hypothetical protein SISNIDRAFT_496915 [Sistotremastrum niveocremeum HHB9708]